MNFWNKKWNELLIIRNCNYKSSTNSNFNKTEKITFLRRHEIIMRNNVTVERIPIEMREDERG